jgi:hypothetical protein
MAKTIANQTALDLFDFNGVSDADKDLVSIVLDDPTARDFAEGAAELLDDSERILDYCRLAYDGMAGADKPAERRRVLAVAATARLAMRKFPDDPDRRKQAWRIPANRPDGASVSGTAIAQRSEAYADVVSAGQTPTRENVKEAFRLTSTGGSKPYREERDAKVKAGEDFVAATADAMTRLLKANKGKAQDKAQKAQAAAQAAEAVAFDADKGTIEDVIFAVEWAHANIARFSADDLKRLTKALAGLAADLAPAK